MTEKRFFTHENMVSDTEMIIPVTLWQNKDQQQKYCDELNNMDNTINNLSEHLEKALQDNVDLNNSKNIAIAELQTENKKLKEEIKKLTTFKKILDYAEKDMNERADWQAYCEKEFEGL